MDFLELFFAEDTAWSEHQRSGNSEVPETNIISGATSSFRLVAGCKTQGELASLVIFPAKKTPALVVLLSQFPDSILYLIPLALYRITTTRRTDRRRRPSHLKSDRKFPSTQLLHKATTEREITASGISLRDTKKLRLCPDTSSIRILR